MPTAKELLQEIVNLSPVYAPFGGKYYDRNCKYCGRHQRCSDTELPYNHAPDCVWLRAVAHLNDVEDLV